MFVRGLFFAVYIIKQMTFFESILSKYANKRLNLKSGHSLCSKILYGTPFVACCHHLGCELTTRFSAVDKSV